ncbi:hypothetical protein EDD15DRAFT_1305091 [Pisolithus albus]|nr:hypothetical protein EDD15DRAFT_1305091 [Pisolithus albus]
MKSSLPSKTYFFIGNCLTRMTGSGLSQPCVVASNREDIRPRLRGTKNSKGMAELSASHGYPPPTLRTPKLASTLIGIIHGYWDAFPSRTDDWTSAVTRSKEDGCICSPADCHGLRKWFDMMVWLEDRTPTLVVGDKSCVRCRSLSRYEDIAANCAVTSHVSLLDVLENYCEVRCGTFDFRPLDATAELLVDRTLEPLMKKHGCNVQYLPSVNRYPELLRPRVRGLLCGSHISGKDRMRTSRLLDNVFVGANDPWVVVGIASDCVVAGKDADLHDLDWHSHFSRFLRCSLQCFDMPVLPRLSSTGLTLCRALDQDYSEGRLFGEIDNDEDYMDDDDSHWVKSDQDGQELRLTTAVIVAVTTFLRNKDVDLQSCRRCQAVCMEFFAGIPSTVGFEVANSGNRDNVLGRGLSSPLEGPLELGMQEPVWMEAFTHMLRSNPTLSKDEIHSRVTGELHRLRQYLDSIGLDILNCLQRSNGGNRPSLRESTLPRRLPGCSISSSSTRSKSDKVEEIKNKLLEMLSKLPPTDCSSSPARSDACRGTRLTLRALALVYTRERPKETRVCAGQLAGWSSPQTRKQRNP